MIEVRISDTFEFRIEDADGREGAVGSCEVASRLPSLYRSERVGIEDRETGGDIVIWGTESLALKGRRGQMVDGRILRR